MITEDVRKAKTQSAHNAAFDKFLSNPMTRMGMSAIPGGATDDALLMIMRAAFDAGCEAGAGSTAGEFLGAILDGMMKEKRPDNR